MAYVLKPQYKYSTEHSLQFCHKFPARNNLIRNSQKQIKMKCCPSMNQNFVPFSPGEVAAQFLLHPASIIMHIHFYALSINHHAAWSLYSVVQIFKLKQHENSCQYRRTFFPGKSHRVKNCVRM